MNATTPDKPGRTDPITTVQGLLELAPALDHPTRRFARDVAAGLLTIATGGKDRADDLLAAAERTDRPTGPQWLADLVQTLRPRWEHRAEIHAAHRSFPLASGGRLTVTEDEDGGRVLLIADEHPDNDYVRPARLAATPDEARALVQAVLDQPAMRTRAPAAPLRWHAAAGSDGTATGRRAASLRPRPDGVTSHWYTLVFRECDGGGWRLALEESHGDPTRPTVYPLGVYSDRDQAETDAQRFENAGLTPLVWNDAAWTDAEGEQRAVSTTRLTDGMASTYYSVWRQGRGGPWALEVGDVVGDGADGGSVRLGTYPDDTSAKAEAQRYEIAALD